MTILPTALPIVHDRRAHVPTLAQALNIFEELAIAYPDRRAQGAYLNERNEPHCIVAFVYARLGGDLTIFRERRLVSQTPLNSASIRFIWEDLFQDYSRHVTAFSIEHHGREQAELHAANFIVATLFIEIQRAQDGVANATWLRAVKRGIRQVVRYLRDDISGLGVQMRGAHAHICDMAIEMLLASLRRLELKTIASA